MASRKNSNKSTSLYCLFLFAITVGFINSVHAATYTTVQDGNWTAAATWSGGNVPDENLTNDIVNIEHHITYNISTNLLIESGTLNVSNILDIGNQNIELGHSSGVININSGLIFIDNGNFKNTLGTVNFSSGAVQICNDNYTNYSIKGTNGNGYIYIDNGNITDGTSPAVNFSNNIAWCLDNGTGTALPTLENCSVAKPPGGCTDTTHYLSSQTFSCDVDAYITHSQSLNVTQSSISSVDIAAGTKTLEQANIHPNVINAIGYNVVDNYIWGYDRGSEKVVRIDNNYNVVSYTIPGLPQNRYHIGDVSQSGILYLAERHNEPNKIYRVDVDPSSATYLQMLSTITLSNSTTFTASDFAFHPGDNMLYIPNSNGHLYKIDPSTGAITDVGDMQIAGYSNANVTFFDKEGYYYINNSSDNNLYRLDLRNPASPNPVGSVFSTISIPAEADGARCPNAPIGSTLTIVHNVINDNGGTNIGSDFAITTNAGTLTADTTLVSGDTTTYTSSPIIVTPGNLTVTAPNVTGYSRPTNLWSCNDSNGLNLTTTHSTSAGLTGSITVANASNITCTITYDDDSSCSALTGDVNVAISPISILKTESGNYKNKLFVATTNHSNNTGNVNAYAIGSDERPESTASTDWNAGGAAAMTSQQRGARLFTTNSNGLVAFNSTNLTNDSFQSNGVPDFQTIKTNVASAAMGRISPNSSITLLQDEVNPLRFLKEPDYRSFYTATISNRSSASGATAPSQVLVTNDDGFLYSFNQSNGDLNWGWMPPSLALELKNAASFADQHYMQGEIDQLDLKSGSAGSYSFASYIAGSYRNGLGQFVLKVGTDSSLASVVWDTDHTTSNALADTAPNQGKRAYFSDANGIQYMAYIITSSGTDSVLHLTRMVDGTHTEVTLGFTATSTPFVMPDLLGSASPTVNTLYLGSDDGNIYAAPLFASDNVTLNSNLGSALYSNPTPVATLHPSGQSSSAILYIDASVAVGGKYHLHAQAEDRITVFDYVSGSTWNPSWTASTGASLTGKWTTTNGTTSFSADSAITPLPANARITDEAYVIANSIVLPVTGAPANATVCYGDASYYFYKLPNGYKPINTFFTTSNHTAITTGKIRIGNGDAMSMHLTTTPVAKRLVALGLADQNISGATGVSESFYVNDPVTTGIRSWKELH